jgi:peptidyl-prolyl cis-trans isomerase C
MAQSEVNWPRAAARGAKPVGVLTLTLCSLILSGAAVAADTRDSTPPSPPPDQAVNHSQDPGVTLTTLADHLDKDANHVVVQIATLPVTQADLAGVIRSMPPSMGNMPGPEIYRHALDVMVRQKAMAVHAMQDHLDQDPALIRQGRVAFERIISDAWLQRQSDIAVTDKALHALYDRDYVGNPGPEEVRASVILVPTEAEAKTLIQAAQSGADFAELARTRSKDPTAAKGGDLGYLMRDATTPEISAAMFSLAPGQLTAYPVATRMGFFVIRVAARRTRAPLTFEEARPRLEQQLRAEAVQAAVGSLLSDIKVIQPGSRP